MRGFKKVLGLVLTVALATSVFTACGNSKKGGDNDNDKKKIGIITMVENGAFMDMKELEHRIIYYESSRGCPFSCSYCLSSIDKKLRFRDTETVKKELQFFIQSIIDSLKRSRLPVHFFIGQFTVFFHLYFLLNLIFPCDFILIAFIFSGLSF